MELIRPMKQSVWRWPAVVNFTFGGMGAGFYLLGLMAAPISDESILRGLLLAPAPAYYLQVALFRLLGPLLAVFGFLALTTEAGRPLRGYNLFRHLRRSWMSRETLAAAIFVPAAGLDWLFPHPALKAIAAFGAFGLMLSQGFILYRARGVTAWNVRPMPAFFVVSGFTTGCGLLLVCSTALGQPVGGPLLLAALLSTLTNVAVWLWYLRGNNAAFRTATAELRAAPALSLTLGVGQVLPLILLGLLLAGDSQPLTAMVSGLCLMLGGASQKWGIVLQAGYLRGIVLPIPR